MTQNQYLHLKNTQNAKENAFIAVLHLKVTVTKAKEQFF